MYHNINKIKEEENIIFSPKWKAITISLIEVLPMKLCEWIMGITIVYKYDIELLVFVLHNTVYYCVSTQFK